mgnify:CR=1 FL=1
MISFDDALVKARKYVADLGAAAGDRFDLLEGETQELESGWVFFFNSAEFVSSGNPMSALAGNGPFFINKEGVIHQLPSSIVWMEEIRKLQ